MGTLNWKELRVRQAELDRPIMVNAAMTDGEVIQERQLALKVELGELANELPQVFKYWSNKKNNYDKAIVEYVDCLHFILSLENFYKFTYEGFGDIKEVDAVTQFNSLFHAVGSLQYDELNKHSRLISIRALFIGLGEMLNFSSDEISAAYDEKYQINIQRQLENY